MHSGSTSIAIIDCEGHGNTRMEEERRGKKAFSTKAKAWRGYQPLTEKEGKALQVVARWRQLTPFP